MEPTNALGDIYELDNRGTNQAYEEEASRLPPATAVERLGHEVFKYECLDRRLKRHHITGGSPYDTECPRRTSLL